MIRAAAGAAGGLLAAALDLVVPQACPGCGLRGVAWCATCDVACSGGTLSVPVPVTGVAPVLVPTLLGCRAATLHAGPAGRAVVAYKDAGGHRLAAPLAALLAAAVRDVLVDAGVPRGTPVWLVPVPGRPEARRRRGADPVPALAGRAARLLRREGLAAHRLAALEHVRGSRDQVGLSGAQRRRNVVGTLRGLPVPAGVVVIVDDVVTTGSTLAEASRALAAADVPTPTSRSAPQAPSPAARLPCAAAVTWSRGRAAPSVPAPWALAL